MATGTDKVKVTVKARTKRVVDMEIPGQISPVFLKLKKGLSVEELVEVAYKLKLSEKAVMWWIGDFAVYVEEAHGEKLLKEISETVEFAYGTVRNCKWVAKEFPPSTRYQNLSFKHHLLAAPMKDTEEREKILIAAAQGDLDEERGIYRPWTTAKLRREIRGAVEPPPLPDGTFRVIYADPPWLYSNSGFAGERVAAEAHYDTQELAEVKALPVGEKSCDETVLFLWATNPLLDQAIDVLREWGFAYKCHLIWKKNRAPGLGWWVSGYHEILLVGVRVNTPQPLKIFSSIQEAPVEGHSKKPDLFYELIEGMFHGPYLELYARERRAGWDAWGNEL